MWISPCVGLLEPGDAAQGRGLARAGRPEQHEELAVADVERQLVHRGHGAEAFAEPAQGDRGHRAQAAARSERPLRLSKKCVRAPSRLSHTALALRPHQLARRARTQALLADRDVDDVVGAERLDQLHLGAHESGRGLQLHAHRLGPDAERQVLRGRRRGLQLLAQCRLSQHEGLADAGQPHTHMVVGELASAVGDVHDRAADELRDEQVGRLVVDLVRGVDLLQHAVVHDADPVGHGHRLDLVVRDVDRGRVVLDVQPAQFGAHLLAQLGVERADRLVHQHRLRPPHQRAADGHALHVAAGQRRRPLLQQVLDAQHLGHRGDLLAHLCVGHAGGAQREGDVVEGAQVRIERVQLEHEGDVALLRRQLVHPPAVDADVARVDALQPGDGAQRRRLAAARRPEQHDELAVPDVQVELADDVVGAEVLVGVDDLDVGHVRVRRPPPATRCARTR